MKKLIFAILLCRASFCLSQTTHSVTVSVNQPPICNIVSVEKNADEHVSVFPSPAKETLYIRGIPDEKVAVEIYDALGRKIYTQTLDEETTTSLDVHTFTRGLYRLVLRSSKETHQTKFVLE